MGVGVSKQGAILRTGIGIPRSEYQIFAVKLNGFALLSIGFRLLGLGKRRSRSVVGPATCAGNRRLFPRRRSRRRSNRRNENQFSWTLRIPLEQSSRVHRLTDADRQARVADLEIEEACAVVGGRLFEQAGDVLRVGGRLGNQQEEPSAARTEQFRAVKVRPNAARAVPRFRESSNADRVAG